MKRILLALVIMCSSAFSLKAEIRMPDDDLTKYRMFALKGNASGQYNLGVCYDNGEGVLKDYKQAVYWYTKAAEQGHAMAQNNLGNCYKNGEGVLKDYKQAIYWFTKAAEQGLAMAQYNLGVCYKNGEGVLKDYKQAVYWHTKAAEQGHAYAQLHLGVCYAYGEGVYKDEIKAYAIALHAKLNGLDTSEFDRFVGYLSLTSKQKEEGQQLAKSLFTD
jgi:TPR repeat protein